MPQTASLCTTHQQLIGIKIRPMRTERRVTIPFGWLDVSIIVLVSHEDIG